MSIDGGDERRDEGDAPGRGRALTRSDEDLDLLARIDEGDIAAAAADWRRRGPRAFRGLLDAADPEDEERDDGR